MRQAVLPTLATVVLGLGTGILFLWLHLPAPFMLGAILSAWLVTSLMRERSSFQLKVDERVRRLTLALVGLLLGSYAGADLVERLSAWWLSILILLITSFSILALTYFYLRRLRGYDPMVAWFSAQPAGLSEIVLISRDYTDKDHIVAFFHLVRVSSIFLIAPLLVWLTVPPFDRPFMPDSQLHIWQLSWGSWLLIPALAGGGFLIATRLRMPMGQLLGPMIAALLWSMLMPSIPIERPFELICLLQAVLGGSIGVRMGRVAFRTYGPYLLDAYTNMLIMVAMSAVGVMLLAWLRDESALAWFLALAPGGLSELSLIAVALGYEVTLVSLHHLIRIGAVMSALPWLTRWVQTSGSN